jgi:hypothetical protein
LKCLKFDVETLGVPELGCVVELIRSLGLLKVLMFPLVSIKGHFLKSFVLLGHGVKVRDLSKDSFDLLLLFCFGLSYFFHLVNFPLVFYLNEFSIH